jgi:four helix bundle protein
MPDTYEEWLGAVPASISEDPLWSFLTYRKALYLADLAWIDCDRLIDDFKGRSLCRQLLASAGSIAANLEEGYSRGFGKDYARFQRIALGSAREARGWYYRTRFLYPRETIDARMKLLDEIIAGLVSASNTQRDARS